MREAIERRMSAFEVWLRTGHRVDAVERKFNPWHDPEDGRFTFRNGRTWTGGGFTGGGGGSMGGGGASGSWGAPGPVRRTRPVVAKTPREMHRAPIPVRVKTPDAGVMPSAPVARVERRIEPPSIDDPKGWQRLRPGRRSSHTQSRTGWLATMAVITSHGFDGPTEAYNHFAQNRDVNRSGYRRLENRWAAAKVAGETVHVTITPHYPGRSSRPDRIEINYTVNGTRSSTTVPNPPGSSEHGQ